MLILVPILLLLFFAVIINFLGRYKLSIGSTWLITAGAVLFVWILLIVFRFAIPGGVSVSNWSPLRVGSDLLVFKLSTNTWVFAFLLASLLIGVVFTDTVRLGHGNNLTTWTGSMILTAVGLLSIYSQTFLAIIITWTIIDIVEFGILIKVINHQRIHFAAVLEFATRLLGTIIIVGVLTFSSFHSIIGENSQYSKAVYVLLILGATLRLGVLPIQVPITANLPIRRSLGTMLRFVSPLSVFSFLSQVQSQTQYWDINNFFFVVALLSVLFGSIKWVTAKNELTGRPFWMLAFSSLVLFSFLRGQVEGLIAFSVIMIICGGFVFFHSFSTKFVSGMSLVCILGTVGIPFTPVAPVWESLIISGQPLSNVILTVSFSFLIFGIFWHISRKKEKEIKKEIWMQLFYSVGLGLLILIPWIIMIWYFRDLSNASNWIAPIICLVNIGLLSVMMRSRLFQQKWIQKPLQRYQPLQKKIGQFFNDLFQFEWIFPILRKLYDLVAVIINFFVNLLEGDGGLLWELLFLALLSSMLIGKILP